MSIPPKIRIALLARFDSLIAEGKTILDSAEIIPAKYDYSEVTRRQYETAASYKKLDWPKYVEWRTKSATLLSSILPKEHVHRSSADGFPGLTPSDSNMQWALSLLRGIKDDFEAGFLDQLSSLIEAEIAADYMGQAERLLTDGKPGKFDHVPAAVLGGAVLEKALRLLCTQQQPAVPLIGGNGEPKTFNPLIDDLKRVGVFNELKAKQLRAWADIRNKAAHGEFDQFTRNDVEQMLAGISHFLADHAK